MSAAEFASSTIQRAWEPPEEVVVPYALAFDPVLQPEDYGVLIRLLLRDPEKKAGVLALAEEFQESGWKMGASRLRGVMARLKKAGHVSHRQAGYDQATGRPAWAFAVYRNPANNPEYVDAGAAAASQVGPMVRNPTGVPNDHSSDASDSNICAGRADGAVSNTSEADSAVSNTSESDICAGRADGAVSNAWVSHPPHPPEEEDSSSPTPPTRTSSGLPSQREEGEAEFSPEEITAAEVFLQQMKRWQAGAATARKCAPRLLRTMRRQGWPELAGATQEQRELLEAEILKNTARAMSWTKCLPGWVEDLRLYDRARSRAVAAQSGDRREPCPDHPARYRIGCIDCAMAVPA